MTDGFFPYHNDSQMTLKQKVQEQPCAGKQTDMSKTHYQSYGDLKKYLLGMCPITWWYNVTGLLSSASYSSNGKQIASISPHADPSAYELVLKTK